MSIVVPALLATTRDELVQLEERAKPFAARVHIDLMDGQFTATPGIVLEELILPEDQVVDFHVMYKQPQAQIASLIKLKPSLIIIHAEAEGDLLQVIQTIQAAGIKAGIALMRSTVPADASALITAADHALIFSGNLGEYGGTANMLQLEKVRLVRAIKPEIEIGWDGGANVTNAYTLSLGGIDVVNVGSALANVPDPAEVYRRLDFEVHRKDILKEQQEAAKTKS